MKKQSKLAAVLVLAAGACPAQGMPPVPPGAVPDYQQILADYEAAVLAARKPGDENLGCDALQTELESIVKAPEFEAYIQAAGAAAQRDLALMQGAQASMVAGVPNASMPVPSMAATENVAERAEQMATLTALMPKMMRAQRVSELATLQACDWLTEGGFTMPGMTDPAAAQE